MGWRDDFVAEEAAPMAGGWRASFKEEPAGPSKGAALARGGLQGLSLGFADEMGGGVQAGLQRLANAMPRGALESLGIDNRYSEAPGTVYREARKENRQADAAAEAAHPGLYRGAEMGGAVATSLVPGLGIAKGAKLLGTMGKMGLQGGIAGLGSSEADLTTGGVGALKRAGFDAAVGAGAGAAGGALGYGIGKGLQLGASKLSGKAGRMVEAAELKAAQDAATAEASVTASAKSAAGTSATDAYKQPANLRELGAVHDLAPDEAQVLAALERELAEKSRAKLLPSAARKAAKGQEYAEAVQTEGARAAANYEERMRPTLGRDARALFKSYGEPILGGALGTYAGNEMFDSPTAGGALGTTLGLLTGRTRMGKAIANKLARPGNQASLANALRAIAGATSGTGKVVEQSKRAPAATFGAEQTDELIHAFPQLAELLRANDEEDSQSLADVLRGRKTGGSK